MKRVLIKLSGEALSRDSKGIYNAEFVDGVAEALAAARGRGFEIAVVVGAGNIWRGRQGTDMDRTDADRMGMLATVINSIYLKDALVRKGQSAVVMSAVPMAPFAEDYSAERAVEHLANGEIAILGAGLGIPFLSTDTAGAVRAVEIGADAMFIAKNVDYIYTADPNIDKNAKKLERVKCSEILSLGLKAIDATAAAFCMANGMPIQVFGLDDANDILKALSGERVGTTVIPE